MLQTLESMIKLPGLRGPIVTRGMIVKAIGHSAQGDHSAQFFLRGANDSLKEILASPEKDFLVQTSTTISGEAANRKFIINGMRISGYAAGSSP